MSPVLVLFVPPDKHGGELLMPKYVQRFYCSTCCWWVSCRKSIYPSIPRTCVLLLMHSHRESVFYVSTVKLSLADSSVDTDLMVITSVQCPESEVQCDSQTYAYTYTHTYIHTANLHRKLSLGPEQRSCPHW